MDTLWFGYCQMCILILRELQSDFRELQSKWGNYKVNTGEVECAIILMMKLIDLR